VSCDLGGVEPWRIQDWANPLVREHMVVYPEATSTIAESWQAGKWLDEVALGELTPMWADWERSPDRHFYVNEVACTKEGRYLVPRRWILYDGEEHADAQIAFINDQVRSQIDL
jgi:hypothetical protein